MTKQPFMAYHVLMAGCFFYWVVLKISLDRFSVCFRGQSVSKQGSNAGIVTERTCTLHRKET